MEYFVYLLYSEKVNKHYIGQTNNLNDRLVRHNGNRVIATKNKGPWTLLYFESFNARSESVVRERYLKSLKSRKAIELLIKK